MSVYRTIGSVVVFSDHFILVLLRLSRRSTEYFPILLTFVWKNCGHAHSSKAIMLGFVFVCKKITDRYL